MLQEVHGSRSNETVLSELGEIVKFNSWENSNVTSGGVSRALNYSIVGRGHDAGWWWWWDEGVKVADGRVGAFPISLNVV